MNIRWQPTNIALIFLWQSSTGFGSVTSDRSPICLKWSIHQYWPMLRISASLVESSQFEMSVQCTVWGLTVSAGLGQVIIGPEWSDGFDHRHDKLHLTVDVLAVPTELQTNKAHHLHQKPPQNAFRSDKKMIQDRTLKRTHYSATSKTISWLINRLLPKTFCLDLQFLLLYSIQHFLFLDSGLIQQVEHPCIRTQYVWATLWTHHHLDFLLTEIISLAEVNHKDFLPTAWRDNLWHSLSE